MKSRGTIGNARVLFKVKDLRIFNRPVLPKIENSYSLGVAVINLADGGNFQRINEAASFYGLNDPRGYEVKDLFNNRSLGTFKPDDKLVVDVNPSGAILLKATLVQ